MCWWCLLFNNAVSSQNYIAVVTSHTSAGNVSMSLLNYLLTYFLHGAESFLRS